MRLTFRNMMMDLNIFNLIQNPEFEDPEAEDEPVAVNMIQEVMQEQLDAEDDDVLNVCLNEINELMLNEDYLNDINFLRESLESVQLKDDSSTLCSTSSPLNELMHNKECLNKPVEKAVNNDSDDDLFDENVEDSYQKWVEATNQLSNPPTVNSIIDSVSEVESEFDLFFNTLLHMMNPYSYSSIPLSEDTLLEDDEVIHTEIISNMQEDQDKMLQEQSSHEKIVKVGRPTFDWVSEGACKLKKWRRRANTFDLTSEGACKLNLNSDESLQERPTILFEPDQTLVYH